MYFKKEKIEEQIFHVEKSDGKKPDLSSNPAINYLINDKDMGITTNHLFLSVDMEQEDGEIYGCSLLSYFKPQEDGSLMDAEGNKVQLILKDTSEPLKVVVITRPNLTDDKKISMDYLSAFCELIGITKGDELFADLLTDDGKKFLISQTSASVSAKSEKELQAQYNEAVEKGKDAMSSSDYAEAKKYFEQTLAIQKKAEEENIKLLPNKPEDFDIGAALAAIDEEESRTLENEKEAQVKASIDPEFLVDDKKYRQYQKFYQELGYKEHIQGNVHFFYSKDWRDYKEDPFILVKRGKDFWENVENDLDTQEDGILENESMVELGFVDGEERKMVQLDTSKESMQVLNVAQESK